MGFRVVEVPVTVHRGPYEGLSEAGAVLARWLEENDREARGPAWDVYRVDAGRASDNLRVGDRRVPAGPVTSEWDFRTNRLSAIAQSCDPGCDP